MAPSSIPLSLHPCIVAWRVPWPELAQLAAEIGYEGAVIPADQPVPVPNFASTPVQATAMQLGVEVRKDEAAFESSFERLRPKCEFAVRAGCRTATLGVIPSAEMPKQEYADTLRRRLKKCCSILDEYSIQLALECVTPLHLRRAHPHEFIWRYEEMLDFGLSINDGCGLLIDSWHWHHSGEESESLRKIPGERILDVHISDSPLAAPAAIRDSERLLPGEGVINFREFFGVLRELGYERHAAVEVFGRGLAQMLPVEAARMAYEASRATLAEI